MKIFSPAKINLYLKIIGRRADDYHNIETVICPIEIFDTLSFFFNEEKISVVSSPEICAEKDNLAFKAADLFFEKADIKAGVKIIIDKIIPAGAGLGGGSSNAASVLLALNRHYEYLFSTEELKSIGLKLGADIPFFIHKKTGDRERYRRKAL